MTQVDLIDEFIKMINIKDYDQMYRFFTKDTKVYLLNVHQEISFNELKNFLVNNVTQTLLVKRRLKSHVCEKVECNILNFYFDVQRKRIRRLELELL